MSLPNEFGTLTDVNWISENTYYKFLEGKNRDGETRYLTTRGPSKEKAATRIPILLPYAIAQDILSKMQTVVLEDWMSPFDEMLRSLSSDITLSDMSVCLMRMPREGNLVSGWEWNAPGGTADVGESFEAIARREFNEETDLAVLAAGPISHFQPTWRQYASGIYDEVQSITFAFVTGQPKKLVEGAREWAQVSLDDFPEWTYMQNDPTYWKGESFVPVDGKVMDNLNLLIMYFRLMQANRSLESADLDPV